MNNAVFWNAEDCLEILKNLLTNVFLCIYYSMKILISGCAGFIGSHLCESLLKASHYIVGIDNYITGKKENINSLLVSKNFKFIQEDVSDRNFYIDEKFDYVLHLAALASPVFYYKYPIKSLMVGAAGTQNMLEIAHSSKADFLLTSTSEVYGDPEIHPQPEEYWGNVNPVGLRSVYDESKRFSESITAAYRRHYGLKTHIVRIFNTYGPRMRKDDGRVIPEFIMSALNNKPIPVFGDGKQTRSFCYINDMVKGIIGMMHSNEPGPINLGNTDEYQIIEVAERIKKIIGSNSKIVFKSLPQDDPKRRKPVIEKAKKTLNWQPVYSLEQGLKETIGWFKKH